MPFSYISVCCGQLAYCGSALSCVYAKHLAELESEKLM